MFVQSFIHALEKNALVSAAAVLFIKKTPQKKQLSIYPTAMCPPKNHPTHRKDGIRTPFCKSGKKRIENE